MQTMIREDMKTDKLDWKSIWIKKGENDFNDLKLLNGFEKTSINPKSVSIEIADLLDINKDTEVLEVGCGAGMLAENLKCGHYVGTDYSHTLIKKHKEILDNEVYVCEANNLPFKNNTFDVVFAYSIFQYFPNLQYAEDVISEMTRISRKAIFIGDLPLNSNESNHTLYSKEDFYDWKITNAFYNNCGGERFNVHKKIYK